MVQDLVAGVCPTEILVTFCHSHQRATCQFAVTVKQEEADRSEESLIVVAVQEVAKELSIEMISKNEMVEVVRWKSVATLAIQLRMTVERTGYENQQKIDMKWRFDR